MAASLRAPSAAPCSCRSVHHQRRRALAARHAAANGVPATTSQRPAQVNAILELIKSTGDRGLQTSPQQRAQVFRLVDELRAQHKPAVPATDAARLSATWKLVWTTEQETQWILKNAWLFGTRAGEVYQVIDVKTNRLQNVITFPPEGAFVVDSAITVEGPVRVGFMFQAAKIRLPGNNTLPVPPYGQGWFDNVYVDETIRIAKDIRNDVLVVERDGPPRLF